MIQKQLPLLLAIIFSLGFNKISSQTKFGIYALEGVNIIDAQNSKPRLNQTIIISQGKILLIGAANTLKVADTIPVIKLKGKFLIPGLIDTHNHLMCMYTERTRTEQKLKEMLFAGITSVRDMANDDRNLSSLAKDALVGDIPSPDIFYSALMAGPKFFTKDPRVPVFSIGGQIGRMPYMQSITDSTDLKIAIAEAKGTGATGIKLYQYLQPDLVYKIAAEAKKQDISVWSHAFLSPAKPSQIIDVAVTSISHSEMLLREYYDTIPKQWKKDTSVAFWSAKIASLPFDELFFKMKSKNVILDATLITNSENEYDATNYIVAKIITRKAYKAGIKICTGTDSQVANTIDEMKLLVRECGFSNYDVLISATKNSAEALGKLSEIGTIEVGKTANMVILEADPTQNIDNIDKVYLVVKSGVLYSR